MMIRYSAISPGDPNDSDGRDSSSHADFDRSVHPSSHRPSATSEDYQGPSILGAESIHNMLERKSWEARQGLCTDYDPRIPGYEIQRRQPANILTTHNKNNNPKKRAREDPTLAQDEENRPPPPNNSDRHNERQRSKDREGYLTYRQDARALGSHRDREDAHPCMERCAQIHVRKDRFRDRTYSQRRDHYYPSTRESRSQSSPPNYARDERDRRRYDYRNEHRHQYRDPNQRYYRSTGRDENKDDGSRAPSPPWQEVRPNRSSRRSSSQETPHSHRDRSDAVPPTPMPAYIPPNDVNTRFQPFVLLLVGVPGAGKTTFARSLEQAMPYKFVRISQDALGSRSLCEDETRKALANHECPVIDRCNFSPEQRKYFIDIAHEAHVPVDCIVLNFDLEECIRRCERRTQHETLHPREARQVLERMIQQFSPPLPNRINKESFRKLREVTDLNTFNDLVLEYLNSS